MTTVNMHEAKTQLSRLVSAAEAGETIVIAKAGRPVARLIRLEADTAPQRLGFLTGQGTIPDDFDDMSASSIRKLFSEDDA